jgi:hypothetical protein|tara:strand:+ start:677 stop:973 length:297 start_codon:yes stop_codon:yes gene_type:complete
MNDDDIIELNKDMRAAGEAASVLNNTEFVKAFDALEQDYIGALLNAGPKDDEHRYRWQVAINVLRAVRAHLHGVLSDGEFAKTKLEDIGKVKPLRSIL